MLYGDIHCKILQIRIKMQVKQGQIILRKSKQTMATDMVLQQKEDRVMKNDVTNK